MTRPRTLAASALAALGAAVAVMQAPGSPDLFWHLASGEWMLDHGRLLDQDVWSFTRLGAPYSVGAWLAEIVTAVAYRAAAWLGIEVLRALLVATATLFTARLTLRVQAYLGWSIAAVAAVLVVSRTAWSDGPQLFTLALFPVVLDLLFAARLDGRVRRLVALPLLFLVWAQLDEGYVLGLVALVAFALEAWLARDTRLRAPIALTAAASLLASFLEPSRWTAGRVFAPYGTLLPGSLVADRPLDVLSGVGPIFAALLLAATGAALVRGRDGIAARLGAPLLWPLLIAPFAILALAIEREVAYGCMVLAPFVAAMVPDALSRPHASARALPRGAAIALSIATALVTIAAVAAAPREPDLTAYPDGALTALRSANGNLLNEYEWGGFLIRYAPEHRIFVDGRGSALFVPDVLDDLERSVAVLPRYRDVLSRWDIALVLVRPDRALAGALREDGWSTLASGERWILLERP